MLRSMTGFGRSVREDSEWTQIWEIRSVNSRHLDVKWYLPAEVRSFETGFEKVLRRFAARGRVEIFLTLQQKAGQSASVCFDSAKAEAMVDAMEAFAERRHLAFEPDFNQLFLVPALWESREIEGDEELTGSLEEGLSAALEDWNESRESEGRALGKDIAVRLQNLQLWVSQIEGRAPEIKEERVALLREKLDEAMSSFDAEGAIGESRFLQEVVILLDRLDVSEELARLHAHLARMDELLAVGEDAGRKTDFTLQECFREIVTCGNKIQDVQAARLVVDCKNELEKCREQVQNLE